MTQSRHIPILVEPITQGLTENLPALVDAHGSGVIIDCTFGGGGHSKALLDKIKELDLSTRVKILGNDRDPAVIERARQNFGAEIEKGHLILQHGPFSTVSNSETSNIFGILADLGFSSDQVDEPTRGLSFQKEGPLDMRMDPTKGKTAFELIQQMPESRLADLIFEYGEERLSRKIAATIKTAIRKKELVNSTTSLAALIHHNVPPTYRHGRIHPATRTFQALRIAVNEELSELELLLSDVIMSLKTGGRTAILSFHSLEDRMVKQAFRGEGFKIITKKPIEVSEEEVKTNPRSRSAKLRIAERKIA